jgi:hypothetical protein
MFYVYSYQNNGMYRLCCDQGSQDASQGYSQGPLTQGGGLSQPGLSLSQPGLSQTELSQVRKSSVLDSSLVTNISPQSEVRIRILP